MDKVKLEKYVEYAFYNPETDRVITAVFGSYKSSFFVTPEHFSHRNIYHYDRDMSLTFTGKHGYVLLGEV